MEGEGITPEVYVSGKKGIAYFKFARRPMVQTFTNLGDKPKYATIEPLADKFIQDYTDGKIDALKVVYMQFISARPATRDRAQSFAADESSQPRGRPTAAGAKPIVFPGMIFFPRRQRFWKIFCRSPSRFRSSRRLSSRRFRSRSRAWSP